MDKRHWVAELEYSVRWAGKSRRFAVCRNGLVTASYAADRNSAIILAILEAKQEAVSTGRRISVTSILNEQKTLEWDSRKLA